ncbi:MAG: hypothetical protein FWD48_03825 [Oscillospiraceae bacterium]|nr:hypothetical protein [Oscillospiraceae bacterium]
MLSRILKQNNIKFIIINLILWSVSVLASKWFSNELVWFLFLGVALLLIFLMAWTIFTFILAVKFCIKHIKSHHIKAFIPILITLLITLAVISVYMFVPFETAKIEFEHMLFKNAREKIASDIKSGTLIVSDGGRVNLSGFSKFLSVSGEAVVYENNNDRVVVGFYLFRTSLSAPSLMIIYSSDGNFDNANLNPYSWRYTLDYIELNENWRYQHNTQEITNQYF